MPFKDKTKERSYWRRKAQKYREAHRAEYNAYQREYKRKRYKLGLIPHQRYIHESFLLSFIIKYPLDFGFKDVILAPQGCGFDLFGVKEDNSVERIEVERILTENRLHYHNHDLRKIDCFITYFKPKNNFGKQVIVVDKRKFFTWFDLIEPIIVMEHQPLRWSMEQPCIISTLK